MAKLCVFFLPVIVIVGFTLIRLADMRIYLFLLYEDSVMESISACLYLTAAILAFLTTRRLFASGFRWAGTVFSLITVLMLFICGEEISWGQRLLGVMSPDYFVTNNTQRETNLHNMAPIQNLLHRAYMVVGLAGSLGWLFCLSLRNGHPVFNRWFVPPWYLALYFLPVFLFYGYYDYVRPFTNPSFVSGRDQEVAEFVLSLGFTGVVLLGFLRARQNSGATAMPGGDIKLHSAAVVPHWEIERLRESVRKPRCQSVRAQIRLVDAAPSTQTGVTMPKSMTG